MNFLKFFLLSFTLIYSALSFAFPALGDFVRYEAHFQGDNYRIEKKVISYDAIKDLFGVRTILLMNNQIAQDEIHELPRSFLYSEEKVENVFKTCVSREGALGFFKVEGKDIKVCEFYDENSQLTYMIGKVPFGQVRFQIYLQDEDFLDFNLIKVYHGE